MKLNKDTLTALGSGLTVSYFVKADTPVYASESSRGSTVLNMGPLQIFFEGDTDMELVNLLLDTRKQQGKSTV